VPSKIAKMPLKIFEGNTKSVVSNGVGKLI
jgi:hypothetical protein